MLESSPSVGVDVPAKRRRCLGAANLDDDEAREVFAAQGLLCALLQARTLDAANRDEPFELLQLSDCLRERHGNAALLPFKQLLAFDDDESAVELAVLAETDARLRLRVVLEGSGRLSRARSVMDMPTPPQKTWFS